jgi:hypothetical protein
MPDGVSLSPGCDPTCPAVVGCPCECGGQDEEWITHQAHAMLTPLFPETCPCAPCKHRRRAEHRPAP